MITTTSLQPVNEYDSFTRIIDYSLESNQSLVSFEIVIADKPDTVDISNKNISGAFRDIFDLGPHALKYRMIDDNSYHSVGRFDELPPKGTCILYEFNPPRVIRRDYEVTATLIYDETLGDEDNRIGIKTRKSDIKTYTLTVYGSYTRYANRMRDYVL